MKKTHQITQCALLYCHDKQGWSFPRLADKFGVSVEVVKRWSKTKEWGNIELSFGSLQKEIESGVMKTLHSADMGEWQEIQKRVAKGQMSLVMKMTVFLTKMMDAIDQEVPTVELLKQCGNLNAISSSITKLQQSANESMNMALAIDEILSTLQEEPKQLELFKT